MRSLPLVAIRRRAAVALLMLTALTGGSYALLQMDTARQTKASKVLTVTARQQMLSQRVALLVQALSGALTPGQRAAAQQRLNRSISLMGGSHNALLNGSGDVPSVDAPAARHQLQQLSQPIRDFLAHA